MLLENDAEFKLGSMCWQFWDKHIFHLTLLLKMQNKRTVLILKSTVSHLFGHGCLSPFPVISL